MRHAELHVRRNRLAHQGPIAAKNFKFAQTCGHLFQAGRPMRVYAVPAVIRLRLVITAITTPLRRVVGEDAGATVASGATMIPEFEGEA
jgi:hypothetical protein